MKHKSSDYKLQAVKYYINNNSSLSKTCAIFNCSNRNLKDGLINIEKLAMLIIRIEKKVLIK